MKKSILCLLGSLAIYSNVLAQELPEICPPLPTPVTFYQERQHDGGKYSLPDHDFIAPLANGYAVGGYGPKIHIWLKTPNQNSYYHAQTLETKDTLLGLAAAKKWNISKCF